MSRRTLGVGLVLVGVLIAAASLFADGLRRRWRSARRTRLEADPGDRRGRGDLRGRAPGRTAQTTIAGTSSNFWIQFQRSIASRRAIRTHPQSGWGPLQRGPVETHHTSPSPDRGYAPTGFSDSEDVRVSPEMGVKH